MTGPHKALYRSPESPVIMIHEGQSMLSCPQISHKGIFEFQHPWDCGSSVTLDRKYPDMLCLVTFSIYINK